MWFEKKTQGQVIICSALSTLGSGDPLGHTSSISGHP